MRSVDHSSGQSQTSSIRIGFITEGRESDQAALVSVGGVERAIATPLRCAAAARARNTLAKGQRSGRRG
jgi:hypothetical protein